MGASKLADWFLINCFAAILADVAHRLDSAEPSSLGATAMVAFPIIHGFLWRGGESGWERSSQ